MTYEEIKGYIGKKVVLTDIDEQKFRGVITNTEVSSIQSRGKRK